ncbi:MAG: hypothetical protein L6Q99_18345 [Planctomycetes bacterium]|nr:hypothetical protein [Planctomycetota bacterium]
MVVHPELAQFVSLTRSFGVQNGVRKRELLKALAARSAWSARALRELHDALEFARAYPDDLQLRGAVQELAASLRERVDRLRDGAFSTALFDSGVPGSALAHTFSFDVVIELVRLFPGALEIDWDEWEDDAAFSDSLSIVLAPGEDQGLEEEGLTLRAWCVRVRPAELTSDLEFLLGLFRRAELPPRVRAQLWDACGVPILYHLERPGTGRIEQELPCAALHFQTTEIERERFPLEPAIRERLAKPKLLSRAAARRVLDVALATLAARALEIYPLTFASDEDVELVDCGRGLGIVLSGVRPERRSALESLHFFLVTKNGVPIAYGPASVLFGTCEMGINLFPEFRGGEIRFVYAQLMRVLHQRLGVEHFFLTRYGMGEQNEDALASGAFWFYRKLGFKPTNPDVETLARAEEARMAREPGYRSDRRMLVRLSHTEAYFDLSNGACRPLDLGTLGALQSRRIASEFGGDRAAASEACTRRATKALAERDFARWPEPERRAFAALAPLLCLLPELPRWSARDRSALVRAIRAKSGRSEAPSARAFAAHPRFARELAALAASAAADATKLGGRAVAPRG